MFLFRILLVAIVAVSWSCSRAEDWPWFLGPRHDGTSAETDANLVWPESGPTVLWKLEVGTGYSAPSVLGDRLVVHHRLDDDEIVSCRTVAHGKELWQYRYPSTFSDPYGYNNGPRCSPVLSGDKCYTLGAEGVLCCLELASGKLLWKHELKEDFELPEWFFGVG